MRSDIGRSSKEEYLAVPAKIGKRLESGDGRLVLVKKTLLPEARIPGQSGRWWLSAHNHRNQSRADTPG